MSKHTELAMTRQTEKPSAPRDDKGRFFSRNCPDPNCGCGQLQYEGDGWWRCDGLVDPARTDQELEACTYAHCDGDAREASHV